MEANNHADENIEETKDKLKINESINNTKGHVDVKIYDYRVKFPFSPYQIQTDYMEHVLKAWSNKKNALLESPTGTGKTLSLLCATLEWLDRHMKGTDVIIGSDSNKYGSKLPKYGSEYMQEAYDIIGIRGKSKIIYCSRTHSQLSQVMDELKNTPYKPRTTILASRDHLCIDSTINQFKGVALNTACKKSLTVGFNGHKWQFYTKDSLTKFISEEQKLGDHHIQDIEDLHKVGKKCKIWPYFLQKERAKTSDLILMPYNYLVDERIRESFELDFKDAIIIIDEAHNIALVCEEVASTDITENKLVAVLGELKKLREYIDGTTFSELNKNSVDTTVSEWNAMYKVMERFLDNLKARGMKKSEWPRFTEKDDYLVSNGANLFDTIYDLTRDKNANQPKLKDTKINEMFGDAGEVKSKRELPSSITGEVKFDGFSYGIDKSMTSINMGNIEVWTEYFENAIKDFTKKNEGHAMLEDIYKALKTLSYLKSKMSPSKLSEEDMELADWISDSGEDENESANDFYIWVSNEKSEFQKKTIRSFGIWCFNPGFAFSEIQKQGVRNIILTSGTLAPMNSFADELQTKFPVELQNGHVIDPQQILLTTLSKGKNKSEFSFTYSSRDNDYMLKDLGESIAEIVKITPDGVLVFFPSYFLMDKCDKLWEKLTIIPKIERYKNYYVEPKQSSQFKRVRSKFEQDIESGRGALLMGVWRGKVSEGLDFTDRAARCVIIIGMPFALWKDPKVQLKMDYLNKMNSKGKSWINGKIWYNQQTSRAINQAIGRAIRHKDDFGLILLIDSRYSQKIYQDERSKWWRDGQINFKSFDEATTKIKKFFSEMDALNLPAKAMKIKKYDYEIGFGDNDYTFEERKDFKFDSFKKSTNGNGSAGYTRTIMKRMPTKFTNGSWFNKVNMLHVVPTYEQMPSPPSSSSSDNENNNIVLNKPKVDIKSNQPMIVKPIPTITEKSYTGFGLGVKQAPQQNSNLKIKELILKIKYVLNLKDSKTIVELIKEVKMNRDKESAIAKFEDLLKCSQINSTDSETAMNDFKTIIGYSKP